MRLGCGDSGHAQDHASVDNTAVPKLAGAYVCSSGGSRSFGASCLSLPLSSCLGSHGRRSGRVNYHSERRKGRKAGNGPLCSSCSLSKKTCQSSLFLDFGHCRKSRGGKQLPNEVRFTSALSRCSNRALSSDSQSVLIMMALGSPIKKKATSKKKNATSGVRTRALLFSPTSSPSETNGKET